MNVTKYYREGTLILQGEIMNSNHSWYTERKKGQCLNIYELGIVAFLASGVVSIYNKKTNLLIADFQAPCIIGLLALKYTEETYYVVTKTNCQFHSIKLEDIRNIIDRKNLWESVFNILSSHMYHYTKIECIFNKKNALDIVTGSVNYINELPLNLGKNMSLYNFILSRCSLSRSAIYNEIKKLENAQLTVNRGVIK